MLNVFVLDLTNNGHLTSLISKDSMLSRHLGAWEETLSIQVLSKNSVFELFSLVVDNLRHTIINYYHIMKITGNFDSSLF